MLLKIQECSQLKKVRCALVYIKVTGNPPGWYKSRSYRSRSVREPRSVLKEFGIDIDNNVRIQVHDSTADMRYIVLPKIPNNMVRKIDDISIEEIESIITGITLVQMCQCMLKMKSCKINVLIS